MPRSLATQVFAFVSAPIDTASPHLCSLAINQLCGIDQNGDGTYITDGITELCEGLKGSAVTSLECAAASCSLLCQRPLTLLSTAPPPRVLAVCHTTASVPKE